MKRTIVAALVVFLIILAMTFPARVAYRWLGPDALLLGGLSGSIWNGAATEGLVGGAYLRDITWQLLPTSLLTGKISFKTSARPVSGRISAEVGIGKNGMLAMSQLSGSMPLDLVHDAIQQAGISGDLKLRFDTLVLKNNLPVLANGYITVSSFYIRELSASVIGNFRADFTMVNGRVTAYVEDASGLLDVTGVISFNEDRSYSFIGEVGTMPGAPTSIEQQFRFLGSADEAGMRPFRFEGRL